MTSPPDRLASTSTSDPRPARPAVPWRRDLPAGVRWAFSTAPDPGAVLGLGTGNPLAARQVHGARAVLVRGPWEGDPPEADALVTDRPGVALAVRVADCVPVLLADPAAGVVGVAHAGRRGMDAGVVAAAVGLMAEVGADPTRTRAVLGPSVCGRCYEVPAAMRDDVASRHPVTASRTWRATPALDVAAGVLEQLARLGVAAEQVPGCTVEDEALGSVRRSGPDAPRWSGLAWRESA